MEEKDTRKETLKPITKANSKLDKELQGWGVESTKGGGELNQKAVRQKFFSLQDKNGGIIEVWCDGLQTKVRL
jgi:hypothetical protein